MSDTVGQLRDDESGFALVTVVGVSTILFLLATMLLILTSNLTTQTQFQESQTKALHMADAGLNAYLYELRRDPTYYVNHPTLGPTGLDDGVWSVEATGPAANGSLTLRATGTIASMSTRKTVIATVRFPTYAEYMFLANADINVGSDALITGKVRSNGSITNAGHITGTAYAAGTVSGSGQFDQGYQANQPKVDFSTVTLDMYNLQQAAQTSNTYFGSSGGLGFRAIINGSNVQIYKVTGGTNTGNLTSVLIKTVSVPANGVFYFNEDVWVSGNYGSKVTFAGARDIYVPDNLTSAQSNAAYSCGLVAQRNIVVPSWYPTMPQVMTISAAMLAQTGTVYGDYHTGVTKSKITLSGSMAYSTFGYFAAYNTYNNTVIAGFRQRVYTYDDRLEVYPPPSYPMLRDGSLKVSTWVEN